MSEVASELGCMVRGCAGEWFCAIALIRTLQKDGFSARGLMVIGDDKRSCMLTVVVVSSSAYKPG